MNIFSVYVVRIHSVIHAYVKPQVTDFCFSHIYVLNNIERAMQKYPNTIKDISYIFWFW